MNRLLRHIIDDAAAAPYHVGDLPQWPHEPVVIVGAGPVGQTAALLLARWGIPTLVLDQRPERDLAGSKAICQQRDVLDIWESIGVGKRIAAEGVTWSVGRTFHRDSELFHTEYEYSKGALFPPFVNISQSRTEAILDDAIAAEPLIRVQWGTHVEAIEEDDEGVNVRCSYSATFSTPFALMCSGARSDQLRAPLGSHFEGRSFDDRFLICDIRADIPEWANERRFYFDPAWNPGRQTLIHPCPESTFRIDWQVPKDFQLEEERSDGRLEDRIRQIIGDRDYELVWSSVYRFYSCCATRLRVGRVLIVGDAAHLLSPFGGRGLNSGVADAENVAWKVAYVGYGWAPSDLLESYHIERREAALENLEVTTATMDFLVPPDAQRERFRADTLARAHSDPDARARVDSGRLAEAFWYPDSPLTTPDDSRPRPSRPPVGLTPVPTAGTLVPDAPVLIDNVIGRLRLLVRSGVLLLGCGFRPDVPPDLSRGPVYSVDADTVGVDGSVASALQCRQGEVWVIRPDGYVAGVVPKQRTAATILRALGNDAVRGVGSNAARAEEVRQT